MRHTVDLSETIKSATEIVEANYVVTYSLRDVPLSRRSSAMVAMLTVHSRELWPHLGRGDLICSSTNTRRRGNYAPRNSGPRTWVASRPSRRDIACEQAPWLASVHTCMCPTPWSADHRGGVVTFLRHPSKACRLVVMGKVRRNRNFTLHGQRFLRRMSRGSHDLYCALPSSQPRFRSHGSCFPAVRLSAPPDHDEDWRLCNQSTHGPFA